MRAVLKGEPRPAPSPEITSIPLSRWHAPTQSYITQGRVAHCPVFYCFKLNASGAASTAFHCRLFKDRLSRCPTRLKPRAICFKSVTIFIDPTWNDVRASQWRRVLQVRLLRQRAQTFTVVIAFAFLLAKQGRESVYPRHLRIRRSSPATSWSISWTPSQNPTHQVSLRTLPFLRVGRNLAGMV